MAYAFASWNVPPLATPFGLLWVDSSSPILFRGTVPQAAVLSAGVTVPPLILGTSLVVQPITVSPTLEVAFGTPTSSVFD